MKPNLKSNENLSAFYTMTSEANWKGGGARHIRNFYKNDNVEIVGWRCAKYTRNISVFAHCQPTISTTSMVVMLLIHWLLFSFPSRLYHWPRRYQRSMETWLTGPVKGGWGVVILSVHSMEPPIYRSDPKTRGKTCCFWLLKGYCTSSAAWSCVRTMQGVHRYISWPYTDK